MLKVYNNIYNNIFIIILLLLIPLLLINCDSKKNDTTIRFATSADYAPFEYIENGEIKGFDIDLANLIAKEMDKTAVFENMQFSAILQALQSNKIDAGISSIAITPDRQKNFTFSTPYYFAKISVIYRNNNKIINVQELSGKKVACQLGSTMEIWLKKNAPDANLVSIDYINQAIELLKANQVDAVLLDTIQGHVFSKKNAELSYTVISQAQDGYAIAFKKDSKLVTQINNILKILEEKGELEKLKNKWFEDTKWMQE